MKVTFELSEKCNAACPLCLRAEANLGNTELFIEDFKHILPEKVLKNDIEQIHFGGNVGDPIAAKDCLKICEYVSENNVSMWLETNGSLRNIEWWKKLGKAFKYSHEESFIVFHIDGLEDTNHLYRQKTIFSKIMDNAKACIDTGATTIWQYIPFLHNEHQIEEARKLSNEMGFRKFIIRKSNRKWSETVKKHNFVNDKGEPAVLEAPSEQYIGLGAKRKKELMRFINGN